MLYVHDYTEGNVTRRIPLNDINHHLIQKKAMDKYRAAVREGQILSAYDDNKWKMFSEGQGYTNIYFGRKKKEILEKLDAGRYRVLIINLKTLVLLRFGTCRQNAISMMVHYILDELAASGFKENTSIPKDTGHGSPLMYMIDFLKASEWGTDEYISECERELIAINIRNKEERKDRKHPCIMNEFQSYFIFDFIIRKAWKDEMNDIQRKFYFPLVFYWMLTTILPLRVMEFCVIPYDCLLKEEGKCYLKIRRTRLKGSTSKDMKIHFYRIDKDYYTQHYEIPTWMYGMVEKWRRDSKEAVHPYGLLFSADYTASLGYRKMFVQSEASIFDTARLGQILKQFYQEFILERENMRLVNEEILMERYINEEDGSYHMLPDEIMMMQLKHTRHLAMINLIRWGCNPMLIKNFAGHTSPQEDENYYSNTTRFIRCATKILWERTRNNANAFIENEAVAEQNNMQAFIDVREPYVETDEGRCYSKEFRNGNYEWCYKCNGECSKCRYSWQEKIEAIKEQEEERINQEAVFVMKLLRSNDVDAKIEEIQQRVLALEADLKEFATKVWKEFMYKGNGEEYGFCS